LPTKFAVPILLELDKERVRSHQWKQIARSKEVDDMGLMEENMTKRGEEMADLRLKYENMMENMQIENKRLKD